AAAANLARMDAVTIDGIELPVEEPATADELAARVAGLAAAGSAVYPLGGGTGLDYGTPPTRPGVALSLARLDRLIDYPARDLTITVEAGMTVARLRELLAAEGQRLPIDIPNPETATIGGAVAVDVSGPRRFGYGTFRDRVIGITVVNDRGELCTAGGRVVKNVAGYDLAKPYTGSLGSLGVITELTFKLQPAPPSSLWAGAWINPGEVAAVLDMIHESQTRPVAVELLNAEAAGRLPVPGRRDSGFSLLVLFED